MLKDLSKLMSKKSEGKLSEQEMEAKMDVLRELLQMAQSAMGDKVKGGMDEMQKVSVMAPDSESLEAGLEMAKEVASEAPEMEEKVEDISPSESPKEEAQEESSEEESDSDDSLFGKRKGPRNKISNMMMDDE